MARRPLPAFSSSGSASITRSREIARTAADSATDVLHPLITILRGLRLLAVSGRQKWAATPKERRGPKLFLAAACVLAVALVPYGPILALITVMGAAAWKGRSDPRADRPGRGGIHPPARPVRGARAVLLGVRRARPALRPRRRLGEGLRRVHLRRRRAAHPPPGSYPAYFTDGEAAARSRIEQLLHTKSGRGREYRFDWDEEANRLVMTVPAPLSTSIAAQRFVTAPGETVLGFTDPDAVRRTVPVRDGDTTVDASPVVWRTGNRSTEPHLLAVGQPGSGTTTLIRSIAVQALQQGDVLVIDGSGTGEYGALTGRTGVLAVESGLGGALATLEWAAHERSGG
ncbi:FtsK domain-containing protein OS=Streptomyces microflavus OX=1919 GN=HUT09_04440 PE=4 SV=1 [Streptomyces microflavus]